MAALVRRSHQIVPHRFEELLFCVSPDVFSSSVCIWICWTYSKLSPPSAILEAPPVTYKPISMSNQGHSLSPNDSRWKIIVSEASFQYQLRIFIELHALITRAWEQAGKSAAWVKALWAKKAALCCSLFLSLSGYSSGFGSGRTQG